MCLGAVGKQVPDEEDEISEQGKHPAGGAYLGHFLGVLSEYLDFGEDVEVIEEPVEQEEASYYDVEHVVCCPLLCQQLLDLLGLIHAFEEPEEFSGIAHVGCVWVGVLKSESNFLAASLLSASSKRCLRKRQAY